MDRDRKPRDERRSSDAGREYLQPRLEDEKPVALGVYQIVCALAHIDESKDPPEVDYHVAFHADLTNPDKPTLTLNKAEEVPSKIQQFELWTGGQIRACGASGLNGFLGRKGMDIALVAANEDITNADYDLVWWTGHQGGFASILASAKKGDKEYLLTADLDTNKITLGGLIFPQDRHFWRFNPVQYRVAAKEVGALMTKTHVPDKCDHTWHNPACPGNPATWTGCVQNGMTCTCTHA